ncbi:hypothetical protein [Streptomyces sp. NPDC059009]|uniref:hypothetical protein n=1 Tax=Streptomyces sp. NPDC059009 TaxID=3346694 RepID=UPI00369BA024
MVELTETMTPRADEAPRARRMTPRMRKGALGLATAALGIGATLGGASAAQADPVPTNKGPHCYHGPANCTLTKYHPRKGTVIVKINLSGHNKQRTFGWDIRKGNKLKCWGTVKESWKTKTYKCKNVPKGKIMLITPYPHSASISMKW